MVNVIFDSRNSKKWPIGPSVHIEVNMISVTVADKAGYTDLVEGTDGTGQIHFNGEIYSIVLPGKPGKGTSQVVFHRHV